MSGWRADLSLEFHSQNGKTILARNHHMGPLMVQRPFYPEENGCCQVCITHPPGGIVGGDIIALEASLAPRCHAQITTTSASKFYRSSGATARLCHVLQVEHDSILEWLPQDSNIYSGALAQLATLVHLRGNARFIGWDILTLGHQPLLKPFDHGAINSNFELWREQQLLLVERAHYEAGSSWLDKPWGLGENSVTGILIATPVHEHSALQVRGNWPGSRHPSPWSSTQMGELLVCRYLGSSVEQARQRFMEAWNVLRRQMTGFPAKKPRLWI